MIADASTGHLAADAPPFESPLPGGPARIPEVRELWSLLHGEVMEPPVSRQLRRSLGFCPRHTWLYAAVEVELGTDPIGASPGHQPFDVCVLHADLLSHAAEQLREVAARRHYRPWGAARPLAGAGVCLVCERLRCMETELSPADRPVGYGAADVRTLVAQVNRLAETARWCRETVDVWRGTVCPHCRDQFLPATLEPSIWDADAASVPSEAEAGQPEGPLAPPCRRHLLDGLPLSRDDAELLETHVGSLRSRLVDLLEWMTFGGRRAASPDLRAAWIEALGWFAGWGVPLRLVQTPSR
jgi:hypothetical protein